jgi:hypothetical protein
MYAPSGYMSVHIMAMERQSFTSEDWLNGTSEEYTAAGKTYTGYCGKYEVQENVIIHHVRARALKSSTPASAISCFV